MADEVEEEVVVEETGAGQYGLDVAAPPAEDEVFSGFVPAGTVDRAALEGTGRQSSVDASFLEPVAQDPVGFAESVVRDPGSAPGVQTLTEMRQAMNPLSEYPLEPGESRAAKELPEIFGGRLVMDPRYEELSATIDDPDADFWVKAGAMMEMQDRDRMMESPVRREWGSGILPDIGRDEALGLAFAGMTMHDPAEFAQVLLKKDDDGNRVFPDIGITHAPDGTIVVNNNKTGAQALINRPGMSMQDTLAAVGITAMYTPAGRLTVQPASWFGRLMVGMGTAGATEHVIQTGQEAIGGAYDKADVAISTALGPVAEVARGLYGMGQKAGRFVGSLIPEKYMKSMKNIIPEGKAAAISFAQNAKQFLTSNRPAILMTEDAVPEIHSPWRQILLKKVERLPWFGTGGKRLAQQEQRVEILRHVAQKYDLNPNNNYGSTVIDSLNAQQGTRMQAARQLIDTGSDVLADVPVKIQGMTKTITGIVNGETAKGALGDQPLINLLNNVRTTVWRGGQPQPGVMPRDFKGLSGWLDDLYERAANTTNPKQKDALLAAARGLEDDLVKAATEAGENNPQMKAAADQWLRGTRQFEDLVVNAERKALDTLIERGEIDTKVMRSVLREGNPRQLQTMYDAMSTEGRTAAQQMIMRNAMRVGGWRRVPAVDMDVTPSKVLKYLENENVEAQLKTFFPDDAAQAELNGLREYLKLTKAAEMISQGKGIAAAGGIEAPKKQTGTNLLNYVTLGAVGGLGHAYQSNTIRNFLLRLYHSKGDVALRDAIFAEMTPVVMAAGRQIAQDATRDDPQNMILASSDFIDYYVDKDGNPVKRSTPGSMPVIGTRTGTDTGEPGLMDRLRGAAEGFMGPTEEPDDMTQRLEEMVLEQRAAEAENNPTREELEQMMYEQNQQ